MKTRSFIAINLPPEIKKYLGELIDELKEKNTDSNIKWVNPEGIHLTLHFLGSLDEEKIEQVKKIIQESSIGLAPLEIELKDLGGFPNLQKPRVLFISGQESSFSAKSADSEDDRFTIKRLQEKLGKELEKIGLEVDKRPWQIHFTLARLKNHQTLHVTCSMLHDLCFQVESIDLMKSELTPQGARYSIIEKFDLS